MKKLKSVLIAIWKKSNKDLLFTHAAALTYYTLIYIIPVLALFYFFFDYFDGFDQVRQSVRGLVGAYLAPQMAETVLGYVDTIQKEVSATTIGIFGVFGFIFSSFLLLTKIEFAFNEMLGSQEPVRRLKRLLKFAILMTIGPVLIGLSILTQQSVYKINQHGLADTALVVIVSVLPLVTTTMFMSFLYKWISRTRLTWKTTIKAGLFAGLGIEIIKQLYAYYVIYSLQNSAYGTMAMFPLFLIWINVVWTVALLGGQICCYYHTKKP